MNKKPISISFANQKGGIGKSTLTVLAASWLRYVRGLNVLVVDCDFPQNSIVELREREKKAVMKNDAYKLMLQRQFERLQKKAYPVIRSTPENADNDVQVFLASEPEPYDVVLAGHYGHKGRNLYDFVAELSLYPYAGRPSCDAKYAELRTDGLR